MGYAKCKRELIESVWQVQMLYTKEFQSKHRIVGLMLTHSNGFYNTESIYQNYIILTSPQVVKPDKLMF